MKVVFFNHWHNGDVHVSRGIVKQIMNKVHQIDPSIEFEYGHRNSINLLTDIPNLKFHANDISWINPHTSVLTVGEITYINTWYDQQYQKYAKQNGILTLDSLVAALDETCQQLWSFSLLKTVNDPTDFFPSIDYSKFDINSTSQWLNKHPEPKILIENGNALSGQASNFAMTPIIMELAKQHPDKTFILSQKDYAETLSNVVYTGDVIKKSGTDLNEISFLSTYCNLIVGRSSGVFSFSVVKENLFQRKIKLISFSHLMAGQNKFWLGRLLQDKINYSSTIFVTNESDTKKVSEVINGNL